MSRLSKKETTIEFENQEAIKTSKFDFFVLLRLFDDAINALLFSYIDKITQEQFDIRRSPNLDWKHFGMTRSATLIALRL